MHRSLCGKKPVLKYTVIVSGLILTGIGFNGGFFIYETFFHTHFTGTPEFDEALPTRTKSDHAFIISATYLHNGSASYPNNTVAVLFNARREFNKELLCWSRNQSREMSMPAQILQIAHPSGHCLWEGFIANCPVVESLTSFGFASSNSGGDVEVVQVPFREAVKEKYGVVACISPQFCVERWQLNIHMLEMYRQYGVDLQVYYFESMLAEIYEFMKVYEKLKLVAVEPWAKIAVDTQSLGELGYDPNLEVEVRNQPTAYNDCLLKYKLAAEFIIFGDTDDILYPRYADTYLEEFRKLAARYPLGGAFLYTRYNANFLSSRTPAGYSVSSLIKETQITHWVSEKYVGIPSRVRTSYIHWPAMMEEGHNLQRVPTDVNMMVHLRHWRTVDRYTGDLPKYILNFFRKEHKPAAPYENITQLIEEEKINSLETKFREFLVENGAVQLFERMPDQVLYYPTLERCYDTMMYGRDSMPIECVGHTICPIAPVKGVKCATISPVYEHHRLPGSFVLHYAAYPRDIIIRNDGCLF